MSPTEAGPHAKTAQPHGTVTRDELSAWCAKVVDPDDQPEAAFADAELLQPPSRLACSRKWYPPCPSCGGSVFEPYDDELLFAFTVCVNEPNAPTARFGPCGCVLTVTGLKGDAR